MCGVCACKGLKTWCHLARSPAVAARKLVARLDEEGKTAG